MDLSQDEMIKQTYALTRENNRMLHAMRRGAFLGGLFRIVMWLAFIIVPAWLYYIYLAPVMTSALNTMQAVQQGGAQAQIQLQDFQKTLQQLRSAIPTIPGLPSAAAPKQ